MRLARLRTEDFPTSSTCPSDLIEVHLVSSEPAGPTPHTGSSLFPTAQWRWALCCHFTLNRQYLFIFISSLAYSQGGRQWWFLTPEKVKASTLMLMERKIPEVTCFCQCTVCFSIQVINRIHEGAQWMFAVEPVWLHSISPHVTTDSWILTYLHFCFPRCSRFCVTRGHFMWKHNNF